MLGRSGNPLALTARRGVLLAFGTAAISGLSVYLNSFGVKVVSDAAVYTTAKNGVAAIVLVALALAFGAGREARTLDNRNRLGLVAIAIIGGSIPFVLFFSGLAIATAPTAAFIQKTMFIWVALMAVPFLGERLGFIQIAALGTLLAGQALIAPPTGMGWGTGETMIAAATLLWSVEVVLAKRLLVGISPQLLGAARLGLGLVILVGYLAVSGKLGGFGSIPSEGWMWVLITGGLLAGYVATWFRALQLAPATTVTSVLVVAAVVTGILSALNKGAAPDPRVIAGYLLIIAGTALVALFTALRPSAAHATPAGADA
ncbi:MAG: DMT family transporter [Chloroflexi bacterium]|nr:DMT family transporter [Chloroflexota bacterium]